jgi:hypothetical protein
MLSPAHQLGEITSPNAAPEDEPMKLKTSVKAGAAKDPKVFLLDGAQG